jgi:hypothetical protein
MTTRGAIGCHHHRTREGQGNADVTLQSPLGRTQEPIGVSYLTLKKMPEVSQRVSSAVPQHTKRGDALPNEEKSFAKYSVESIRERSVRMSLRTSERGHVQKRRELN